MLNNLDQWRSPYLPDSLYGFDALYSLPNASLKAVRAAK